MVAPTTLAEAIRAIGAWQAALAVCDPAEFRRTCRTASQKTDAFEKAAAWLALGQHPKETVAAYLTGGSGGRIYVTQ